MQVGQKLPISSEDLWEINKTTTNCKPEKDEKMALYW
jgi:hypothetical protein